MSSIKLIHEALSDSDIRKILGHDTKIIKYSELSQFEDLSQLLPNLKDYCVILCVDHGHWVDTTVNLSTSAATASSRTRSSSGSTRR